METKIVKLMGNEDVICGYEERDNKCFFKKPAKIAMFPTENGGLGMAIMPWIPFSDDLEIEVRKESILSVMNPSDDVRNEYSQRFGTGIVTPTKDIII